MISIISLISVAVIVGLDQLIKWLVLKNLEFKGSVPFIHFGDVEIINLSYHKNTGAAFSIFSGMQIFLIVVTSIFIIAGIYAIVSGKVRRPSLVASFTLIIGGGIGNLIDRIFRGFVIDYIEVRLFDFAVFNFADCCVIIGAALFIIVYIFFDKSKKAQRKKELSENE